jgi:hypothetical protein
MEPEGSSPCSQQPASGSYPEPDESNPHLEIKVPLPSGWGLREGPVTCLRKNKTTQTSAEFRNRLMDLIPGRG